MRVYIKHTNTFHKSYNISPYQFRLSLLFCLYFIGLKLKEKNAWYFFSQHCGSFAGLDPVPNFKPAPKHRHPAKKTFTVGHLEAEIIVPYYRCYAAKK